MVLFQLANLFGKLSDSFLINGGADFCIGLSLFEFILNNINLILKVIAFLN